MKVMKPHANRYGNFLSPSTLAPVEYGEVSTYPAFSSERTESFMLLSEGSTS